jgi:hypothetical protein
MPVSSGSTGFTTNAVTAGTANMTFAGALQKTVTKFSLTNAMVVALGAGLSGNVSLCTLPAKTRVENCYIVVTSAAVGPTTVTVSIGRTAAAYVDYIVASNAKTTATYGDASGERGTNLVMYDVPSFSSTTVVNVQFVSTGANLNTVTGFAADVYLETVQLP